MPLLATKSYIPPARPNRVPRPRLIEQLNRSRPLTLIAAPAGFGKTTLLSDWIPHSEQCVTWLSLDEDDNDPIRFWVYVVAALQRLRPDLGESASALLQSPQPPPITSILSMLINEISSFPENFFIILDDYHLIKTQSIHEALTFLLDHLPPQMHLIITTRADPPLPIPRLRARNHLTELRADDLRFTSNETAVFLNELMGLRLSSENIAVLEARTEGWIAGLQLAALSMQGREDVTSFIRAFSGSHRHVLTYLAEEVLERCSADTLNFLLQTSVLDRLCGPLCDAVTGDSGGQARLENLEHANLFLIPLDEEATWYRYHHLFAEVLRAKLQQSQSDRIPELHHRAGEWLEQQGFMAEAVSHAFVSQDFERAADLIEAVGVTQFGQPIVQHSLKTWLAALPQKTIDSRPMILLIHAWQLVVQLDMAASSRQVDDAEQMLQKIRSTVEPNQVRNLTGAIAAMRAFSNAFTPSPDLDQVLASAAIALAQLDPDQFNFRGMAAGAAGAAHLKRGDLVQAERMFVGAVEAGRAAENVYMLAAATDNLVQVMRAQGRLHEAITLCQRTQEGITQRGQQGFPPVAMIYTSLADLLREINEMDAARYFADKSVLLADSSTNPGQAVFSYFVLAHVKQAQGNWDGALDVLEKVSSWMRQQPMMWYLDLLPAVEAQFRAMRGDLAQSFRWASATNWLEGPLAQVSTTWELIWQYEHLRMARAQIFIAQGQATGDHELIREAAAYLNRQQVIAETKGLVWFQIKLLALQALCSSCLGQSSESLELLERALILAQPESYIRVFADEGEPMRGLISAFQSKQKNHPLQAYAEKLLAAFGPPHTPATSASSLPSVNQNLVEPLSGRELDVLRLIVDGLSNQAIAQKLFLSVGTVKVHIKHIYAKLDVNSRTQAVARVSALDLH
jgi:LuxR family maltose regulon positive regulatory protein